MRKSWLARARLSAKARHFRGGFIGPFKLIGHESLTISSRYP